MTKEKKQNMIENLNRAIVTLGGVKVRVDEIASIGFPISQAIQNLGELYNALNEESIEENQDEEAADN